MQNESSLSDNNLTIDIEKGQIVSRGETPNFYSSDSLRSDSLRFYDRSATLQASYPISQSPTDVKELIPDSDFVLDGSENPTFNAESVRGRTFKAYQALHASPIFISLDDPSYADGMKTTNVNKPVSSKNSTLNKLIPKKMNQSLNVISQQRENESYAGKESDRTHQVNQSIQTQLTNEMLAPLYISNQDDSAHIKTMDQGVQTVIQHDKYMMDRTTPDSGYVSSKVQLFDVSVQTVNVADISVQTSFDADIKEELTEGLLQSNIKSVLAQSSAHEQKDTGCIQRNKDAETQTVDTDSNQKIRYVVT